MRPLILFACLLTVGAPLTVAAQEAQSPSAHAEAETPDCMAAHAIFWQASRDSARDVAHAIVTVCADVIDPAGNMSCATGKDCPAADAAKAQVLLEGRREEALALVILARNDLPGRSGRDE